MSCESIGDGLNSVSEKVLESYDGEKFNLLL